jgi:hypothetical protein
VPRPHHFASPSAFGAALRFEADVRGHRWRMERGLARAGRTGTRVVVGPWLSEIGFEVLYWIPLLRRLLQRSGVRPAQVTAISRGGAGDWYAGLADGYVDAHDLMDQNEYLAGQESRVDAAGDEKQMQVTALDRELWRRAGLGDATVVHPLVMYSRLRYWWAGEAGPDELRLRCDWRRFHAPEPPSGQLPERFVAAKPYFSACFPETPANLRFVSELLLEIAGAVDVVLLSTGLRLDEHAEADLADHPHIHRLGDLEARTNLAEQSRVLARADGLVSTYGGPAYLGSFLGVPTVGIASVPNHNPRHLEAAEMAAAAMGSPAPILVDVDQAGARLAALRAVGVEADPAPAGGPVAGAGGRAHDRPARGVEDR